MKNGRCSAGHVGCPWGEKEHFHAPCVICDIFRKARKEAALQALVNHISGKADAVIAMHRPDENSDEVIQQMINTGEWELDPDQPTETIGGKRVRYLRRVQVAP